MRPIWNQNTATLEANSYLSFKIRGPWRAFLTPPQNLDFQIYISITPTKILPVVTGIALCGYTLLNIYIQHQA